MSSNSAQTGSLTAIKFMGPAQQEFKSFFEQANYFLNEYRENWNNYTDPKSYIIPPIFEFQHREVNDEAYETYKSETAQRKTPHAVVSNRIADEAEFLVFDAIQKLIEKNLFAPFVAIRGLDLQLNYQKENGGFTGFLTKLFLDIDWDIVRNLLGKDNQEYDFLLIGPYIGIWVIEVKSSDFKTDFRERDICLPHEYSKGLKQLHSSIALKYLLKECTNSSMNNQKIGKILFTPNLERMRFNNWIGQLKDNYKAEVKEKIDNVILLFSEDSNNGSMESNLFSTFQHVLVSSIRLNQQIYENYCPILAGIASANLFTSNTSNTQVQVTQTVQFEELNFSETANAQALNPCFIGQSPLHGEKNTKMSPASNLIKVAKTDLLPKEERVYYMTPDQQRALTDKSKIQFVQGAAGTGKTIVLQTKSVQVLKKQESLLCIATKSMVEKYENLFSTYSDSDIYKVLDYGSLESLKEIVNKRALSAVGFFGSSSTLYDPEINKMRQEFAPYENVMIDDGLELSATGPVRIRGELLPFTIPVPLDEIFPKAKCVWVAMDPTGYTLGEGSSMKEVKYFKIPVKKSQSRNRQSENQTTTLRQVLRCSVNIINAVYDNNKSILFQQLSPVAGHKIIGDSCIEITRSYETLREGLAQFWDTLEKAVNNLLHHGMNVENCIVICSSYHMCEVLTDKITEVWPGLKMECWDDVSSLEWPCVIHVNFEPREEGPPQVRDYEYRCYRAKSRATSKLVSICFSYTKSTTEIEWTPAEVETLIEIKTALKLKYPTLSKDKINSSANLFFDFNRKVNTECGRSPHEIVRKLTEIENSNA